MKTTIACVMMLLSANAWSAVTCQDINQDEIKTIQSGDVLNRTNWKTIDVLAEMEFDRCFSAIDQTLIEINGERFWSFRSTEDECDGGNSYGSIYSYDLKTPLAHIYDSDIYCEEDWREEARAVNHRCDLAAEELAMQKMKDFGFDFEAKSSSLEIRRPYIYSYVYVSGIIKNKNNREATLKVLTDIDSCKFASVSIDYLNL